MARIITKEEVAQSTELQRFSCARLLSDGRTVVKTGSTIRMAEADTMRLVRQKTSIPVPEVYNTYIDAQSGHVCIVMEFVQGERLDHAWPKLSEEDKNSIVIQLAGFFKQLRQIKGSFIGAVDGSPLDEQLFPDIEGVYGPFKTEDAFNRALIDAWRKEYPDDVFIRILCKMQLDIKDHDFVLTHNDIAVRNILVQGDKVSAVVDWGRSGFYPEYWEFFKALWRPEWDTAWMKEGLMERILDPYLKEAAVLLHTSYRIW
jgi:aminoglycoside phosphotransferase (APT) family kinase protein